MKNVETIEETKLVNITIENGNSYHKCTSYKVYIACIVLISIILAIGIGTGIYFVYYHRHLKKYGTYSVFHTHTETIIY